jgi:O-antigen/teichoic acid export membrane protein
MAIEAVRAPVIGAGIRAKRLTRHVFVGYVYASILTVCVGWALLEFGGLEGAVVGLTLAQVVVAFVFVRVHLGNRGEDGAAAAFGADRRPRLADVC